MKKYQHVESKEIKLEFDWVMEYCKNYELTIGQALRCFKDDVNAGIYLGCINDVK